MFSFFPCLTLLYSSIPGWTLILLLSLYSSWFIVKASLCTDQVASHLHFDEYQYTYSQVGFQPHKGRHFASGILCPSCPGPWLSKRSVPAVNRGVTVPTSSSGWLSLHASSKNQFLLERGEKNLRYDSGLWLYKVHPCPTKSSCLIFNCMRGAVRAWHSRKKRV